ncbi:flagellar biosynthesis protein FlhA [Lacisediminimonas sp.]|uniref:flagellar biosynthesis protein FlhA n=1 Tax=Lacisediminimonas sp. TaxID=3060582 RepID=UPI002725DBBF|nr:flagellar biosynthesis protein FlhA [Lacisediminimonas sp.]MDO8299536.1 flagellar biosynthesis protein FlhA [Lacisediminimonas sp.]
MLMLASFRSVLGRNADAALVVLTLGILVVLFTPIPPRLLDLLLLLNLCLALLTLLLTFYVDKPVQFSTFPSLLLITTLFRLSLNIAATRLILSSADGGRVIGTIGDFVVGGNYVIGLIVFLILVIIQYVVVTSGAQRVAEVAARFTLDSMPGQQMSIDADLNMGFIDQAEAQKRRRNLEKEANFYGAMDGASKFVKGDAIAGIIILLVNMLGGWAIGIMQLGMKWDEALRTFTLLTIGDGIVTQVPALVIALGTGIIVTRSASDERLSTEVTSQLTALPKLLYMVVAALAVAMLLPGMPAGPVAILMVAFGAVAWLTGRTRAAAASADARTGDHDDAASASEDLYQLLGVEALEVKVGAALSLAVNDDNAMLKERLAALRKSTALESGFVLPRMRIRTDEKLAANTYEIHASGVALAQGEIFTDRLLAIHPDGDVRTVPGTLTRDPSFGLTALWIDKALRAEARQAGYTLVDPPLVFITHLNEAIRQNAAALLSRMETERLLDNFRKTNPGLVEELVPTVLSLSEIQKVLQGLLRERVPVRQLERILEALVDHGRQSKDPDYLVELVRQKLGAVICHSLAGDRGELTVLTLDPAIEQTIAAGVRAANAQGAPVLEPQFAEQLLSRLAAQAQRMAKSNALPVLLVAPEVRRHMRRLTERLIPQLNVISMSEIAPSINLRAFGVVTI